MKQRQDTRCKNSMWIGYKYRHDYPS